MAEYSSGGLDVDAFCRVVRLPAEVARAWHSWFADGPNALVAAEAVQFKVKQLVQAEESEELAERILFEVLAADADSRVGCEEAARLLAASWASSRDVRDADDELLELAERLLRRLDAEGRGSLSLGDWARIKDIFPGFSHTVPTPISASAGQDGADSSSMDASFGLSWGRAFLASRKAKSRRWWACRPACMSNVDLAWTVTLAGLFVCCGSLGFHYAWLALEAGQAPLAVSKWYALARAAGAALLPMCAMLLPPICGEVLAFLRHYGAHKLLPLDSAIGFHEWVAHWILVASLTHTVGHLANYAHSEEFSLVERLLSMDGVSAKFTGVAGATGVLLLSMLLVVSTFAHRRLRCHCAFWCTHTLWLPWYACLCLHAPSCWRWVLAPLLLWLANRAVRAACSRGRTAIVGIDALAAGCTYVTVARPPGFAFRAGMWCRVMVPRLSSFEWHPFTISSAPEVKDTFSLHVRAVGDWTTSLRELAARLPPGEQLPLRVQGPFGAPAQHAWDGEHVVLIGAGIGVTPFASILQSIAIQRCRHQFRTSTGHSLEDAQEPYEKGSKSRRCSSSTATGVSSTLGRARVQHVDFIWVNKELGSFTWFASLLARLAKENRVLSGDGDPFINFFLYLTSLRDDSVALLKLMLRLAVDQDTHHDHPDHEPITVITNNVHPGRPDWPMLFGRIKSNMRGQVKVLFCGPKPLGTTIQKICGQFGFAFAQEHF